MLNSEEISEEMAEREESSGESSAQGRLFDDERAILMCGVSGSGKTHNSGKLELEGFVRISVDEMVWERFGSAFLKLPFAEQKESITAVLAEAEARLVELLDRGERVVVDATYCKREKREAVCRLCREHGVDPLIAYVEVPFATLCERMSRRGGSGPNDQVVPRERLEEFFRNFEPPSADERHVRL